MEEQQTGNAHDWPIAPGESPCGYDCEDCGASYTAPFYPVGDDAICMEICRSCDADRTVLAAQAEGL